MSNVRKYLDLSTGNVTHEEWQALESGHLRALLVECSLIFNSHPYGGWLWVAEDGIEELRKLAPNIAAVMEKAHKLDCQWINFDQDAEPDSDLPSFEW